MTLPDSIRTAASTIAYGLMTYYSGNQTGKEPGTLSPPYYWWEAGAMWAAMVEYWHYTGDTSYNDVVAQAILAQASPTNDFLMPSKAGQTVRILFSRVTWNRQDLGERDLTEDEYKGNDDQAFWALTAMTAAERSFPIPTTAKVTYIELAKNVFNDMASPRWNTSTCNGGLQWQFNPKNAGFYYKSSIANGAFFQLAARLSRYTGNSTYGSWAEKTYDWMAGVGLLSGTYDVYDGADDNSNCTGIDHDQWSYNAATMLLGTAVLANISSPSSANSTSSIWTARAQGILTAASSRFFTPFPNATSIMFESNCEAASTCDTDQLSFKAYLARWMLTAAQLAPDLKPQILTLITASAQGAAQSCSGSTRTEYNNSTTVCGTKWYIGGWDGTKGLGQQMAALDTIQGLLINGTEPPLIDTTPGSSSDSRRSPDPDTDLGRDRDGDGDGRVDRGVDILQQVFLSPAVNSCLLASSTS